MMKNLNKDGNTTKPLQILTLNVNGLHNDNKRRNIFKILQTKT